MTNRVQLPVRLTRRWEFHHDLTLGNIRAIVAEADRRRLADTASVTVDPRGAFIAGVDPDGNPDKPYPHGNGGHYVTEVVVRGDVLAQPLTQG